MAPYKVSCRDTKKIYIPVLPTPALQWISQGPVFGLSRSFLPYCEARARTTSINCSKTEACKFEKNNENKYIFLNSLSVWFAKRSGTNLPLKILT